MDINEKVEELMKITAALKNEVNELKGKDLNTRLDELELEKEALKDDITDLRHTLMKQNEKILSLISQQNDKLVDTIESDKLAPQLVFSRKISKYSRLFPIKSLKELDELEKIIDEKNVNEFIAIVRQLLQPKGIVKNISLVMSVPCIMECNVDGHHNKRRLLNSPKFMDLIYRSAYDIGCSQKTFLDEVRRGFKMVKNRHNKNLCRYRQIQRQREEQAELEEIDDDVHIIPEDLIKTEHMGNELKETEKIYFD